MADRYASLGKEVLKDGKHYADVCSPEEASRTAEALNIAERMIDDGK